MAACPSRRPVGSDLRDRRAWRSPDAPCPPGTTRRMRPDGREYLLTVPAGRRAGRRAARWCSTSTASPRTSCSRRTTAGCRASARERGYLVVTPQGTGRVPRWTFPRLPGPDDAAFLRVGDRRGRGGARRSIARRSSPTGISNGAAMTMALAESGRDTFAGSRPSRASTPSPRVRCRASRSARSTARRPHRARTAAARCSPGCGPAGDGLRRRRTGPPFELPPVEDVMTAYARRERRHRRADRHDDRRRRAPSALRRREPRSSCS